MCIANVTSARSWPIRHRRWHAVSLMLAVGLFLMLPERAHAQDNLLLAAGEAGDAHHALGVGLMSLVKVTLLHEQNIDLSLVEEADPTRRAGLLQSGDVDLALLSENESTTRTAENRLGVISLFKLSGEDGVPDETISLVASNDLDAALVQNLTRAIVGEERWLSGALPGLSRIAPDQPENAGLTWHPGALAFHKTLYPNLATSSLVPATLTANEAPIGRPDIFVIYLDDQEAALDETTQRQIDQACNHALQHDAASVMINGPPDIMAPDASGLQLSDAKAQATLDQLRTRDGCRNIVVANEPDGKTFTQRYDPEVPITEERRLEIGVIFNR